MKRSWIGAGLLLGLLGLGILSSFFMQRCHGPLSQAICRASVLAAEGNLEQAEYYVNRAETRWQENWGFAASFADHQPMERINSLFARLKICARMEDAAAYALLCGELAQELSAIGEAHCPTWWNLL